MSQYSVLLVDDEEFVFEVMMEKLNWEEMGFKIEGYARNGLEALEIAEEMQPDVVMTDIKMPYMDGLTLSKKLKELYPNIKIIIFSGFDDFEFAKEAIRLEAEEYILKPIDSEELRGVFERVKKTLDKEIDERRNVDKLQEYYLNSLPMLQDNFFIALIEGRVHENLISKYASDYQLDFSFHYMTACVLHVSYEEKTGKEVEVAPFLLSLSVRKLTEEQLATRWKFRILTYQGDIVVITGLEREGDITAFTDHMDRICKMAKRVCKVSVTAGIGYVIDNPIDLKMSYTEARSALAHRVIYGDTRAINIREIEVERADRGNHIEPKTSHYIVKAIKLDDEQELESKIDEFCNKLREPGLPIRDYRVSLMKLSVELMEFMEDYELNQDRIIGENKDIMETLISQETPEDFKRYLTEICRKLMEAVNDKRQDNRASFVVQAEDYVKENYRDKNLGIDSICQYLNLSASYFSVAFKKATGKTFINYLTDYRMEAAVKLLETTELKTYEIADQIGYQDPNYFSYAFKKKYGVSPSKYKPN